MRTRNNKSFSGPLRKIRRNEQRRYDSSRDKRTDSADDDDDDDDDDWNDTEVDSSRGHVAGEMSRNLSRLVEASRRHRNKRTRTSPSSSALTAARW